MIQTVEMHTAETDTIEINSSPVVESSDIKTQTKKSNDMKPKTPVIIVILLVATISGIGTGLGLHKLNANSGSLLSSSSEAGNIKEQTPTNDIKVGDVYGSPKEDIFKDAAEGVVVAGGMDGEGTHQLIRPGGPSQTVYLTSSVTDLDKFVGARIKVWGETNTAQKVGWLMDVGRVKVEELNAKLPEDSKPETSKSTSKKSTAPKEGD
jgi:hypothetical protein